MKYHRRFLLAAAIVAVLLPAQVRAEEEEFPDLQAPGYKQCVAKAHSTADRITCEKLSYEYWDQRLNTNWKKLMAALKPRSEERQTVREAQRRWVKYKEAHFKALQAAFDGSKGSALAMSFLNAETRKQSLEIESMLAASE